MCSNSVHLVSVIANTVYKAEPCTNKMIHKNRNVPFWQWN